jgi:hypothetical protein
MTIKRNSRPVRGGWSGQMPIGIPLPVCLSRERACRPFTSSRSWPPDRACTGAHMSRLWRRTIVARGAVWGLACLLPLLSAFAVPAGAGNDRKTFSFEFEGGPVWQTRNQVRISGDAGTEFSFQNLTGSGPYIWAFSPPLESYRQTGFVSPATKASCRYPRSERWLL